MNKMPTADQVQSINNYLNKKHKILKVNSAAWFNKIYKIKEGGGELLCTIMFSQQL